MYNDKKKKNCSGRDCGNSGDCYGTAIIELRTVIGRRGEYDEKVVEKRSSSDLSAGVGDGHDRLCGGSDDSQRNYH